MGRQLPSKRSAGGLFMIIAGAIGYVLTDSQFAMESFWAYQWAAAYFVVTVAIMTFGKFLTSSIKLSLSGSVAYSNALSLPVMLVLMVASDEMSTLRTVEFTSMGMVWLSFSCLVGTGISYAGWWCRSQVSATSFTVIGVVNKALTLSLNRMIAWGGDSSLMGLACLIVAIGGGLVYTEAPMRKAGANSDTTKVVVIAVGIVAFAGACVSMFPSGSPAADMRVVA
jgi:hypothetical protein